MKPSKSKRGLTITIRNNLSNTYGKKSKKKGFISGNGTHEQSFDSMSIFSPSQNPVNNVHKLKFMINQKETFDLYNNDVSHKNKKRVKKIKLRGDENYSQIEGFNSSLMAQSVLAGEQSVQPDSPDQPLMPNKTLNNVKMASYNSSQKNI